MLRSIASIVAGAVVWAVLWVGSSAGLATALPHIIQPGVRLENVSVLVLYIVLSVIFSIGAGYVTAMVAKRKEIAHTLALGLLQLALGIYFELSYWELLPVWYHLVFLVLLIPGNVSGGYIRMRRVLRPLPA